MRKENNKKPKKKPEREPIDFNKGFNMDEFFKNIFGAGFNFPNFNMNSQENSFNGESPNIKSNSITYRFGNNMDKPEIRINGEPVDVDEKFIENFMAGKLPENIAFGNNQFMPTTIDAGDVTLNSNPLDIDYTESDGNDFGTKDIEYEIPYSEIEDYSEKHEAEITMQLPSIEPDEIIINYFQDSLMITAENDYRKFQISYDLSFEPDKTKTKITENNGIFQIYLRR